MGATGNAASPGNAAIGAMQLCTVTPTAGSTLTAGVFTSADLSTIGLPGISIAFNNNGGAIMTVQVHVRNYTGQQIDLPSFVVAAGGDTFVSYDHIGTRVAWFTIVGTGTDAFQAALSATAT